MKLDLRQIMDNAGERQTFAGEMDLSWIKRQGRELFSAPVRFEAEASNRAGIVMLRLHVMGEMPFLCDRCQIQSVRKLDEEFSHTVVRSLADEEQDDEFLVLPNGTLELDELAGADIQLSLPQILLCREDCRGLCPTCGADRNQHPCDCEKQA
jgi:uncharacterized protein